MKAFLILFISLLSLELHAQAIGDTKYGNNDPTNLTDQDRDLSENFVHDERVQRIYEEECTKDSETEDACLGSKADPKVMGLKSSMVSALAKAYTMIVGFGAGGELEKAEVDTKTVKKDDAVKSDDAKEENEQKDYCKYIPVATEAIAMFNTTTEQKTIGMLPKSEATAQKESLLKAAENHESRAKTAKIQTTGWGASTACYAYMMAPGLGSASGTSWTNWMKLGASTLLTAFYSKQIGAHQGYADKTRAIANKLPGKGDCNPITDKLCFCTEPTSKKRPDYGKYCMPHLHNRRVAYTSEKTTCIDENMKEDPGCQCAIRETCVDKKVMTTIKGFGGTGFLASADFGNFKTLSNGELKSNSLSDSQRAVNNAIKQLRKAERKLPESNSILSKKQREEYNLLKEMGLPDKIAKKFAQTPLSPAAKKNIANFKNGYTGSNKGYSRRGSSKKKRSNVLTFSGGSGTKVKKKSKSSSRNDFLKRFGLKKKKRRKKSNGKVLKFANRAQRQAQISKSSDKVIFDIISRRYQVSGWKRLEYIK